MDHFQALRQKLEVDGFSPRRILTGQKRAFKWRWMATALWENVVAFEATTLDVPVLAALIEQAKQWAISNKRGWMRGMQSGQAVLAIVMADKITDAARQMAAQTWDIEFARFTVVAVTDGKVATVANGPKAMGAIYRPHITKRLSTLTASPGGGRGLQAFHLTTRPTRLAFGSRRVTS